MSPRCPVCLRNPAYVGAGTQPPGECEDCRKKALRRSAKSPRFWPPPFETFKFSETSLVVSLKGGPLRDRHYIIPIRDELRVFAKDFTHNPFDAVTVNRTGKQLLGHSKAKPRN